MFNSSTARLLCHRNGSDYNAEFILYKNTLPNARPNDKRKQQHTHSVRYKECAHEERRKNNAKKQRENCSTQKTSEIGGVYPRCDGYVEGGGWLCPTHPVSLKSVDSFLVYACVCVCEYRCSCVWVFIFVSNCWGMGGIPRKFVLLVWCWVL